MLIKELLDLKGKVNLFTCPRRFGKTLNLSMLRYFFEDTQDVEQNAQNKMLFQGMEIMETGQVYTDHMGKYPVLNLTLKSAKQENFDMAYYMIQAEIASEFDRHRSIIEQGKELLTQKEYEQYLDIADEKADEKLIRGSLKLFCKCLQKITGQNTVILIDEYDVPLENAYFRGFYEKMVDFNGKYTFLKVRVPNTEVMTIYETTIMNWMKERLKKQDFHDLYRAMEEGMQKR